MIQDRQRLPVSGRQRVPTVSYRTTARSRGKEEDVRIAVAALALLAVVFVVGCQDTKKVTELQGQLDKANQQLTELQGQLTKVTAEKDSLAKVITDMTAAKGAKLPPANKKTGATGGTKTLPPPVKK
jgi:hypothetical protein